MVNLLKYVYQDQVSIWASCCGLSGPASALSYSPVTAADGIHRVAHRPAQPRGRGSCCFRLSHRSLRCREIPGPEGRGGDDFAAATSVAGSYSFGGKLCARKSLLRCDRVCEAGDGGQCCRKLGERRWRLATSRAAQRYHVVTLPGILYPIPRSLWTDESCVLLLFSFSLAHCPAAVPTMRIPGGDLCCLRASRPGRAALPYRR